MKIITYSNPFELKQLPEWKSFCKYPHLCVSQTLVEGLKEYYGRETFTLLCTVDQVLSEFYDEWHNNSENQLEQFIELSNKIKEMPNGELKRAFEHNRGDLLKSIRFFIEAGIQEEDINESELSNEQKNFILLLNKLRQSECFMALDLQSERGKDGLKEIGIEILKKEFYKYVTLTKEEKENTNTFELLQDEAIKEKMIESINEVDSYNDKKDVKSSKRRKYIAQLCLDNINKKRCIDYSTIVFHGIHQFTPLILKFIDRLEELEIQVVCMFNYVEEYASIYQTWDEVYKWTHLIPEHYGNLDGIVARKVGENVGYVIEGQLSKRSKTNEVINKFTNLTSFADYVATFYSKAKKLAEESAIQKGRKKEDVRKLEIIARMDEQFYAVNGSEFNEILKVYFPEHFGGRHFLTYPIGQFILGLYNMWDKKKRKLVIDEKNIKECLALNIWKIQSSVTPLEIYSDLKVYFKGASTFDDFKNRIDKIVDIIEKRQDKAEVYNRLKKMSFFKYSVKEMKELKKVIESLQKIADSIFEQTEVGKTQVNVKDHYENLLNCIIKATKDSNITKEETDFINHIGKQLEKIKMKDLVADIVDIRETLHFYLNDPSSDNEAEWIVRDFEQIDGGVLLAKEENKRKDFSEVGSTCFHYGGISDTNMLKGRNSELPWPLTINMVSKMNRITKIITTCKKEYANFLRYSLFYGTYFLSPTKDIIFSYVEEEENNKKADPYSILTLLKLEEVEKNESDIFGESTIQTIHDITEIQNIETLTFEEKRAANVCYRRFIFNCCLDLETTFNEEFDVFYIAQVFAAMSLAKLSEDKKEKGLKQFKEIFPFMTTLDLKKIEKMSERFNESHLQDKEYLDTRLEYKYGRWIVEGETQNLLAPVYSANKIGREKTINLIKAVDQYINSDEVNFLSKNHNWKFCDVCNQKYVCCYYVKVREEREWEEDY